MNRPIWAGSMATCPKRGSGGPAAATAPSIAPSTSPCAARAARSAAITVAALMPAQARGTPASQPAWQLCHWRRCTQGGLPDWPQGWMIKQQMAQTSCVCDFRPTDDALDAHRYVRAKSGVIECAHNMRKECTQCALHPSYHALQC